MRPQTIILLLLCAAACADNSMAGTSTGNPQPGDDAGDRDARSEEDADDLGGFANGEGGFCRAGEKTDVALDDDAALGFSAEDVLAFAGGTHEEALRWLPIMNGSYGPESGEGSITITVTHDGAEARVVQPDENPSGEEFLTDLDGSLCQPWLELDVAVTVETSGGALDESFDAVLRTQNAVAAFLFVHPDPDALNGSFSADYDIEGFNLEQLDLGITLTPFGTSGTFSGVFVMHSDDAVSAGAGGGPFATFGPASCADGGFGIGSDDEIEINGQDIAVSDVLALAAASDEVELTWEDDATTTSTLAFTPEGDGGCVQLNNTTQGDVTLVVYGALAMASADGRLDGEWNGRIEARADSSGALSAQFILQDKRLDSPEGDVNALYGFPNADDDVSGFDYAGLSVSVSMTSGADATGEVKLSGFIQADCVTEPVPPEDQDPGMGMGTPGCRGSDEVPVAVGTF
jgi:hypothetical protein